MMRRNRRPLLAAALTIFCISGCGGSGSSSSNGGPASTADQLTQVLIGIEWQPRTRHLQAPGGTESLTLVLPGGNPDGADFVWTINRSSTPEAFSDIYRSPHAARVGPYTVTVRYYAEPDGSGTLLREASGAVQLLLDGTGIEDIPGEDTGDTH